MQSQTEAAPGKLRRYVLPTVAFAVLGLWLGGMTTGLTASACLNDRRDDATRLRFCTISLTVGGWLDALPTEAAKRARVQLERGILLAGLGRDTEAIRAFSTALQNARKQPGHWEQGLLERMATVQDRRTVGLWDGVFRSAKPTGSVGPKP